MWVGSPGQGPWTLRSAPAPGGCCVPADFWLSATQAHVAISSDFISNENLGFKCCGLIQNKIKTKTTSVQTCQNTSVRQGHRWATCGFCFSSGCNLLNSLNAFLYFLTWLPNSNQFKVQQTTNIQELRILVGPFHCMPFSSLPLYLAYFYFLSCSRFTSTLSGSFSLCRVTPEVSQAPVLAARWTVLQGGQSSSSESALLPLLNSELLTVSELNTLLSGCPACSCFRNSPELQSLSPSNSSFYFLT